jgi:hypothetical protein
MLVSFTSIKGPNLGPVTLPALRCNRAIVCITTGALYGGLAIVRTYVTRFGLAFRAITPLRLGNWWGHNCLRTRKRNFDKQQFVGGFYSRNILGAEDGKLVLVTNEVEEINITSKIDQSTVI